MKPTPPLTLLANAVLLIGAIRLRTLLVGCALVGAVVITGCGQEPATEPAAVVTPLAGTVLPAIVAAPTATPTATATPRGILSPIPSASPSARPGSNGTQASTPAVPPTATPIIASRATPLALPAPAKPSRYATPALPVPRIDTYSGGYAYGRTDIATGGDEPRLLFQRAYLSHDTRLTSMGPGWTNNFNIRLNSPGNGTQDIIVVGPYGHSDTYQHNPDGSYSPVLGVGAALTKNPDGTYTVSHYDGTIWFFDFKGQLTAIRDGANHQTTLTYDAVSQRLTAISDPAGRGVLRLGYDEKGRLASVTDWLTPPRVVRYTYDERHRLTSVADREGQVTRFTYDGDSQRLATITDARGHVAVTLTYNEERRAITRHDARGRRTGQATTLTYQRNPDGTRVTVHRYPPSGFAPQWRPTITDTHDQRGLLIRRVTEPAPGDEPLVEERAYDAEYSRTASSRTGGTTPRPALTPVAGSIEPASDPSVPDPARLVSWIVDAIAASGTNVRRDAFGRVTEFDAPLERLPPMAGFLPGAAPGAGFFWPGAMPATAPTDHSWRVEYDREDRVRAVETRRQAPGSPRLLTTFRYDEVGNLVEAVEPDGQTTRYAYDERDSLAEIQTSSGLKVQLEHDDRDDLARIRVMPAGGAKEQVTDYAYDGLHRLRRVTRYPDWSGTARRQVTEYSYDADGRRTAFTSGD